MTRPSLERPVSVEPPVIQKDGLEDYSVADHRPDGHEPLNLTVSKTKSFSTRVKTPTQALTFVRFLLAKVVYRRSLLALSVPERILLEDSREILRNVKDPSFIARHKRTVASFAYIYAMVSRGTLNPEVDHTFWWNSLQSTTVGFPSMNAYFGWWKTFDIKAWFRFKNRALKPKSPPKRFIGVGYQDHGTTQNVAEDASPRWQEIAGARLFLSEAESPYGAPSLSL